MTLLLLLATIGATPLQEQGGKSDSPKLKLQSPAEMLKVMSDSKIVYEVGVYLDSLDEEPERTVLSEVFFVGSRSDGTHAVMSEVSLYESSPAASEHLSAAEKAFQDRRLEEARNHYSLALSVAPETSQFMTFIGQTYGIAGDSAAARDWYTKALDKNPMNYLAWFLLADLDRIAGNRELAVERITTSHLLNRNNPRVLAAMEKINSQAGNPYDPWEIAPRFELSQDDSGVVKVSVWEEEPSEWMMYAMCKALWRYEPGYREEMTAGRGEPLRLLEERACLVGTLLGAKNRLDNEPDSELSDTLKNIDRAANSGKLDELAIYEIVLVDDPWFAYTLPEPALKELRAYVAEYH